MPWDGSAFALYDGNDNTRISIYDSFSTRTRRGHGVGRM
jgi:hypothetical protein